MSKVTVEIWSDKDGEPYMLISKKYFICTKCSMIIVSEDGEHVCRVLKRIEDE